MSAFAAAFEARTPLRATTPSKPRDKWRGPRVSQGWTGACILVLTDSDGRREVLFRENPVAATCTADAYRYGGWRVEIEQVTP